MYIDFHINLTKFLLTPKMLRFPPIPPFIFRLQFFKESKMLAHTHCRPYFPILRFTYLIKGIFVTHKSASYSIQR